MTRLDLANVPLHIFINNMGEEAVNILSNMLDQLGFDAEVELQQVEQGACLQITSPDEKYLIGSKGDRLDDIQYLVNRVLQAKIPDSDRVRVDCDGYRERSEAQLKEKVSRIADEVKHSGKAKRLPPLNAYHRRLVHNFLAENEFVETSSPEGKSRFKKIVVFPKR